MKAQSPLRENQETLLVAQLATCVAFLAFLFYLRQREVLLYGDAVAHINIARRVFDSRTPGLLQLGTVWLPLPHLLMLPFLISNWAWQSGVGGSIPSLVGYILSVAGIFRLTRGVCGAGPAEPAPFAAWAATLAFAANPNLIYLQTTAMTEPIYLAWFVWTAVYFAEFVRRSRERRAGTEAASSLMKCGWCVFGACLTRYDGWLMAVALWVAVPIVWHSARPSLEGKRGKVAAFLVLAAAAPVLWLGYNAAVYRNPLEFANGPYSAHAIEQKSAGEGNATHPGAGNLLVAGSYFLKSAELNVATGNWGRWWLLAALVGTVVVLLRDRLWWPLLLLWTPLPFYMLSVAYGGVPIFLPTWWPFSYYNARYGLELLPALAVFGGIAAQYAAHLRQEKRSRRTIGLAMVVLAGASYAYLWREQPICLREAQVNSWTRITLETALADNLQKLPTGSTLLMYLGDHVGALQQAGIPLKRVINEGNHRPWEKPSDAEGLWELALANPKQYVDFVVAMEGDPVAQGVSKQSLSSIVVIHTTGQPRATIYSTGRSSR